MQPNTNYTRSIHICIFINYNGNQLTTSAKIAASLKTNPVVVRRIVSMLKAHAIIKSVAGAQGGFQLNKPASQITLWEIYLAVREVSFFQRPKVNPECVISSNLSILVHDTFTQAELSMQQSLSQMNIASLTQHLHSILGEVDLSSP